jgi:hypothetical protein
LLRVLARWPIKTKGDAATAVTSQEGIMRRVTLSEIHEQPWFPARLRDEVTDALQFILSTIQMYRSIVPRLGAAIEACGTRRVVDVCSGAGGPWTWLPRALATNGFAPVRVILTDRYPNLAAFRRAQESSGGAIDYCADPIDAQKIPPQLCGFRTMFSTLHHFPPDEIAAILRGAVSRGEGLGFFEAAKRRPRTIFYACFMAMGALCMVPFMRPFRFARLIWTYLLPVIPFVLFFDGVLSCLRAYSPAELREMSSRVGAKNYLWDVGESGAVTYLIGYPSARS